MALQQLLCLQLIVLYGVFSIEMPRFLYHDEAWLTDYLTEISGTFPEITQLYSIGKSVENRDLLVLVIGKLPTEHVPLRPDVKYIGNLHGNEVVSRELLIHLIHHLVTKYGHNTTITHLLDTTRVHILVCMNPDGYKRAVYGDCTGSEGRKTTNDVDINRSFPSFFQKNRVRATSETKAVMKWLKQFQFVLSATLHGGAVRANYPYDNPQKFRPERKYHASPDDDVFRHLALMYSRAHATMNSGVVCSEGVNHFPDGIVNGAQWNPTIGSMQDYNYIFGGCMELTLDVSCCKFPAHETLPGFWKENKEALILLLTSAHMGVKGVVKDINGAAIPDASVRIVGRLHKVMTNRRGEFWRLLLPGSYTIQVSAYHHSSVTYAFNVANSIQQRPLQGSSLLISLGRNTIRSSMNADGVLVFKITLSPDGDQNLRDAFSPENPDVASGENSNVNYAKHLKFESGEYLEQNSGTSDYPDANSIFDLAGGGTSDYPDANSIFDSAGGGTSDYPDANSIFDSAGGGTSDYPEFNQDQGGSSAVNDGWNPAGTWPPFDENFSPVNEQYYQQGEKGNSAQLSSTIEFLFLSCCASFLRL